MTILQFASKHWINIPVEVLKKAGVNSIRSYRSTFKGSPIKVNENGLEVFDYPDSFEPNIQRVFRRMIKIKRFAPELKPQRVKKRIARIAYSSKDLGNG